MQYRQALASFGQERIWSLCQSFPEVTLYNIGFSMYLEGDFKVGLTEDVLNIIVKRHESLRTTFTVIDDELKQIILPELNLKPSIIYRENLALNAIPDEIKQIAKAEMHKPFDLQDGPLFRNLIIKFAEDRYGWIVIFHHAISDGWSAGLFIYEINIIYRALATNALLKLADVPMQYAEYVNLQRNKINSAQFIQSLQFWEKKLSGIVKKINIPAESKMNELAFVEYHHCLSPEIISQLNDLSKQYETTLFMILFIAYRLTLWQAQGQQDNIITVIKADRNNYKLQKTIGYLLNLVPIKTIIPDNFCMADFIKQVISVMKESFSHADVPIEYLSKHLQLSNLPAENPFYQTLFSFQNFPVPTNIYDYKIIESCDYYDVTEFNLTFRVTTREEKCDIKMIYNPNHYRYETIQQLVKQYAEVLKTMLAAR